LRIARTAIQFSKSAIILLKALSIPALFGIFLLVYANHKGRRKMTNRKFLPGILSMALVFSFVLAGCGNDGDDQEPELAKWAGTWNPYHEYFDEPQLLAILEAQYGPYKETMSFEGFKAFVKAIAMTDFSSFVIQGDTISFYDQKQTQKNPSGNVLETVTYSFKGVRSDVWGKGGAEEEAFDWYAFEGDREGAHKYLLLEEAGRDTPAGPLHFHMRYGGIGFDDLLLTPTDNYNRWAPTIVRYDTTIAQLEAFMSGD
jgi:Zn/Cd-binding protein ZinT